MKKYRDLPCKGCGCELVELVNWTKTNIERHHRICVGCIAQIDKKYAEENKEKIRQQRKEYREKNKERLKLIQYEKYHNNKEQSKEKCKQYRIKNRNKISEQRKANRQVGRDYERNRKKSDPVYKLRKNTSIIINKALKKNGSSKNSVSILKYLNYSFKELKDYIESLFEPWMNWDNNKKYDPSTWDDNDKSTWAWNLDHIRPQCLFKYNSMESEEFKQCWELNNLRPLSAKINNIEQHYRTEEQILEIKQKIKERLNECRKRDSK